LRWHARSPKLAKFLTKDGVSMSGGKQAEAQGLRDHLSRFRENVRRHPVLNTTWQVGVFAVGVTVLAAGVAMLVLPGPGWVAIFLGFAILATEFAWAQTALHKAKLAAKKAKDKTLDPAVRRRNMIIAVVVGVLVGLAIIVYLSAFGFSLPWNI
jgi:uncharacterized protein (TIGR02611 family)